LVIARVASATVRDIDVGPADAQPHTIRAANPEPAIRIANDLHALAFRDTKYRLCLDGRGDRIRKCSEMTVHFRAIVFRFLNAASCGHPIITMRTTGMTTASDRMKK
jgi:hypothetical protein